jgi:hypothetical protein
MKDKSDLCPRWAEIALQGLAFWIGHRHSLYRDHPLSEGALVAETCNLIQANLGDGQNLICEVQYNRLISSRKLRKSLGEKTRTDLVVVNELTCKKARNQRDLAKNVFAVIELKRAWAGKKKIA